ncbi:hypothetical protein BOP93_25325 [Pseudomonas orientalis]|uniref:Uncharacterized protein n=1 Tax=Pseudomonas orientalis TaxID=76758 RepID=A0A2L0S3A3_9PSED|nr:hypothetical protein BOP93_25325 [Pseudomonas orientalis]
MPPIITGLLADAMLWVDGNLFVQRMAKCLAADRIQDETGNRTLLKRYLTIEHYRLSERLQLD